MPIPPDGAVLVARDSAAGTLLAEAPPGTQVGLRPAIRPEWPNVAHAVGGGPVIVRNGGAVFRANEAFTPSQLEPRHPRTAIGQRADASLLFVVADGRRPGYSVGLTNFGLAQTLVRLGAVTASALDAGGSSTLAFDGRLLNRPSDPAGERPVSTALMLTYTGLYLPRPIATVSPNGDGVDEDPRLRLKVVRPSTVTTTLVRPDGSTAPETMQRGPGVYRWPCRRR